MPAWTANKHKYDEEYLFYGKAMVFYCCMPNGPVLRHFSNDLIGCIAEAVGHVIKLENHSPMYGKLSLVVAGEKYQCPN